VKLRFDFKVLPNNTHLSGTIVGLPTTGWNLDQSPYAPCEAAKGVGGSPTLDELDYVLLRLERPIGREDFTPGETLKPRRRGWVALPDRVPHLAPKAPLVIAQHPHGAPLKLAIDTEAFLGVMFDNSRIRYTTNTEPGSSGSPVFDFKGHLVAIHHLGDPAYDGLSAQYNQGIPIDVIRRRILDPTRPGADERLAALGNSPDPSRAIH
jgi:hypothetical protein